MALGTFIGVLSALALGGFSASNVWGGLNINRQQNASREFAKEMEDLYDENREETQSFTREQWDYYDTERDEERQFQTDTEESRNRKLLESRRRYLVSSSIAELNQLRALKGDADTKENIAFIILEMRRFRNQSQSVEGTDPTEYDPPEEHYLFAENQTDDLEENYYV